MIIKKFIYKVSKSFTLNQGHLEKFSLDDKDRKHKSGSHFSIGDAYVDYESTENNIKITEMTKILLTKKFLKLQSQVEI